MSTVEQVIREFIESEIMDGEETEELTGTTSLKNTGILDSISTLKLVTFIEEKYDVEVEAHEMDETNMGSLQSISSLVESKLG